MLLFQISLLALITVEVILNCNCFHAFVVAEHISGVVLSTVTFKMSVEKNHGFSVRIALTVPRSNLIFSNTYETSIKPLLLTYCVLNYVHRSFVWLLSSLNAVWSHSCALRTYVSSHLPSCLMLYSSVRKLLYSCMLLSFILFTKIVPTF